MKVYDFTDGEGKVRIKESRVKEVNLFNLLSLSHRIMNPLPSTLYQPLRPLDTIRRLGWKKIN